MRFYTFKAEPDRDDRCGLWRQLTGRSASTGIFAHGGLFQPHARAPSLDHHNPPWIPGGGQALGSRDRLVDIRRVEARSSPAPLGGLFVSLNHAVVLHLAESQR